MHPPARAEFAAQVRNAGTSSGKTQQILNAHTGGYVTSPPFTNADYPLL